MQDSIETCRVLCGKHEICAVTNISIDPWEGIQFTVRYCLVLPMKDKMKVMQDVIQLLQYKYRAIPIQFICRSMDIWPTCFQRFPQAKSSDPQQHITMIQIQ